MSLNNDESDKNLDSEFDLNIPESESYKNNTILSQIENFKRDFYVHHIDGDIRNNRKSNLKIVPIETINDLKNIPSK